MTTLIDKFLNKEFLCGVEEHQILNDYVCCAANDIYINKETLEPVEQHDEFVNSLEHYFEFEELVEPYVYDWNMYTMSVLRSKMFGTYYRKNDRYYKGLEPQIRFGWTTVLKYKQEVVVYE